MPTVAARLWRFTLIQVGVSRYAGKGYRPLLPLVKDGSGLNCPDTLIIAETVRGHGLPGPGLDLVVGVFCKRIKITFLRPSWDDCKLLLRSVTAFGIEYLLPVLG